MWAFSSFFFAVLLSSTLPLITQGQSSTCATNNDCFNGGQCVTQPDGVTKKCDCTSAYSGSNCADECLISCWNDAECVIAIDEHAFLDIGASEFECICKPGWRGVSCNIRVEECPDGIHECWHQGTCLLNDSTTGTYGCSCTNGFMGDKCETQITPSPTPFSCSICGPNKQVTNPNTIFVYATYPQHACGDLEEAGRNGTIPENQCLILPQIQELNDQCGCMDASSMVNDTPMPTPFPTTANTPFPTPSPTPFPTLTGAGALNNNNNNTGGGGGLSTGAVAGICIGALIVGILLLGGVVVYTRSQKNKELGTMGTTTSVAVVANDTASNNTSTMTTEEKDKTAEIL